MNRYPASPQYLTAMHKYFGRFLASLSAMVAIAPLPLSASGILPTYDVDRILLVASASFLCMLAFGIVFHFRVEIATAMGYLGPYKGPDQLQKTATIRTILLLAPVFLAAASTWAIAEYQGLLDDSIAITEAIRVAETRAIEGNSDFAAKTLEVLSSSAPAEKRMQEMARFRGAWPILNEHSRKEILATVQSPPFRNILKFWYILAFVCGELALCLMALRSFQRDLHEMQQRSRKECG